MLQWWRAPTCVTIKRVLRSGSRPISLDKIISSMSPCSFSMTTKTYCAVSNIPSSRTTPRWDRLWTADTNSMRCMECTGFFVFVFYSFEEKSPPPGWALHSSSVALVWTGSDSCRSPWRRLADPTSDGYLKNGTSFRHLKSPQWHHWWRKCSELKQQNIFHILSISHHGGKSAANNVLRQSCDPECRGIWIHGQR